jgi:DNA-binding IclR family transcriptional regulator
MAGAINKAFRVIRLLRRSAAALTLSEIARELRVAPSTAHAILLELADQGAVLQDDSRRYRLGPAMFYLGAAYMRNAAVYRGVWSELVELARDIGLTAVIAVPWEDHHLILNVHRGGPPGLEVAFGGLVPLDAGAWGKAYFAWSRQAPPRRGNDSTSKAELETARAQGYATDAEEFVPGAGAIASAITSENGFEGIAALVGTTSRLSQLGFDEVGQRLAGVASRASYALGDHTRVKLLGIDERGGPSRDGGRSRTIRRNA